jgi:hypothetical protein
MLSAEALTTRACRLVEPIKDSLLSPELVSMLQVRHPFIQGFAKYSEHHHQVEGSQ